MPAKNHVHKYEWVTLGTANKFEVFRCAFPDCSHYITKNLGFGKLTVCWGCLKEFTLTRKNRQRRPTCGCRAKKLIEIKDERAARVDQDAIFAAIAAISKGD